MTGEELAAAADELLVGRHGCARHYQVRILLPGGRVITCGARGCARDWVRDDYARLFAARPAQVQVTRLRHPPRWQRL